MMKKYNLSKIMKRAWELVKKLGLTISGGLKRAWKEAKEKKMEGTENQIKFAEDLKKKTLSYLDERAKKAQERGNIIKMQAIQQVKAEYEDFFKRSEKASQIIDALAYSAFDDAAYRCAEVSRKMAGKPWADEGTYVFDLTRMKYRRA